jgi:hypothetical protein
MDSLLLSTSRREKTVESPSTGFGMREKLGKQVTNDYPFP